MQTLGQVGGELARLANELPQTPEVEGYKQIITQTTTHLLPLAHPERDLRHRLNDRHDAQSYIDSSCARRHEEELRRREDYDWERIMHKQNDSRGTNKECF